jgi:DNA repair exonuclease SbcCD ATPase subunit
MENLESDTSAALAAEVERLSEYSRRLYQQLQEEQRRSERLHDEALRWQKAAEEEHRSWLRTHDAMNLLRADANRVLEEHSALPVYLELEEARERVAKLLAARARWRKLARQSAEAKSSVSQHNRELQQVITELVELTNRLDEERNAAVSQAEKIISERDVQLARFRGWCERWYKGEVGAIEVIAGITAELGGNIMSEPSEIERRKAIQHAETVSLLNESTDHLTKVVDVISAAGVDFVSTPLDMVKHLVLLYKAQEETINEWKTLEAAARGAAMQLAQRFNAGDKVINCLVTGDYEGARNMLEDGRD